MTGSPFLDENRRFGELVVDGPFGCANDVRPVASFDHLLKPEGDEDAEDDGSDFDQELSDGVGRLRLVNVHAASPAHKAELR